MVRQRSILSMLFALLATFLISCSGSTVATVAPSYTPAEVAQIQVYAPKITLVRDRASELEKLIQSSEWIKVGNFIHGPMAEARLNMTYIIPNLAAQDQSKARQITKELLGHLVKVDQAASVGNKNQALANYKEAFADVDKFLSLIPSGSNQ